jgi:hypothetical protein
MVNMRPNVECLVLLHTPKNPLSVSGRLLKWWKTWPAGTCIRSHIVDFASTE